MNEYRLSKYDPKFRDERGVYTKAEWTSFCDIGRVYEGVTFTKEEYLRVESNYVRVILLALLSLGIPSLWIHNPEVPFTVDENRAFLGPHGLTLSQVEEGILSSVREGQSIDVAEIEPYLRLLLRECFWCELRTENNHVILFPGDDYYVHVRCAGLDEKVVADALKYGIYIENCAIDPFVQI